MPQDFIPSIVNVALAFYPRASDRSIIMFTKDVEYLAGSEFYFTAGHVAAAAHKQWGNKNAAQDMAMNLELKVPALSV
jgi:hypothetical protein